MKTITPVTEKRSLATLCGRLVCPTDLTLASSAPNSATPTNVHSRSSWAAPKTNHAQKWKGIIDGYLNPFNSNEPAPKPGNQIGAPQKTLHFSTSLHYITTTTILDQERPANPKLRGKWLISEQTVSQLVRILPVQFATTASTSSTSIGAGPIAEACILKPKVFKMDRLIWRRCCHNGGWGGWKTQENTLIKKHHYTLSVLLNKWGPYNLAGVMRPSSSQAGIRAKRNLWEKVAAMGSLRPYRLATNRFEPQIQWADRTIWPYSDLCRLDRASVVDW